MPSGKVSDLTSLQKLSDLIKITEMTYYDEEYVLQNGNESVIGWDSLSATFVLEENILNILLICYF